MTNQDLNQNGRPNILGSGAHLDHVQVHLDSAFRRITRLNNELRRMPATDPRFEQLAAGLLRAIDTHGEAQRHLHTALRAISLAQNELIRLLDEQESLLANLNPKD